VLQAVHMMLGGGPERPWAAGEPCGSLGVFIGRNFDRGVLLARLHCRVASSARSA